MSQKLENAKNLYMFGIRDGQYKEALDKYTGDKYIQHSTGVADGKEGFIDFFAPFTKRNPIRDIEVIRSFEDGPYVFLHVYQNLNNGEAKWVTMDVFKTDHNDKMIEHWDVIAAYSENTVNGHTMIDGPRVVSDLDQTNANKALVKAFAEDVLVGGNYQNCSHYISSEKYIEHNPQMGDGLEAFIQFFEEQKASGHPVQYKKIHKLIGQGNFVLIYSLVIFQGEEYACFDLFSIENGLITEHWDTLEPILPPNQWNNSGKF